MIRADDKKLIFFGSSFEMANAAEAENLSLVLYEAMLDYAKFRQQKHACDGLNENHREAIRLLLRGETDLARRVALSGGFAEAVHV